MYNLANLQLQTNFLLLLQMPPHNIQLTYITPNNGRPQASRQDEAAKGYRYEKTIPRILDWGVT
jgi:hypothetical protein